MYLLCTNDFAPGSPGIWYSNVDRYDRVSKQKFQKDQNVNEIIVNKHTLTTGLQFGTLASDYGFH